MTRVIIEKSLRPSFLVLILFHSVFDIGKLEYKSRVQNLALLAYNLFEFYFSVEPNPVKVRKAMIFPSNKLVTHYAIKG